MERFALTTVATILCALGGGWLFWLIGWAFDSHGFIVLGNIGAIVLGGRALIWGVTEDFSKSN